MQKVVPLSAHSVARARVGLTASDSRLSRFADLTFGAVPIGRLGAIACLSVARLRFGVVSESVRDGRGWLDFARQVEDSGVDVLLLRDHFSASAFGQQLAPFSGLAAAAAATSRLRLGTMVLSNDFRHPALVAHEAASLHLLSGG
ncbi:MAG: LLM class flavin-dependent oxidoreductase, partial [Streptosporangiaceae bacterium]|nr:LLM class flavin-dependent oxidoreductase [Streptosporangiaceae bacterium]